jgi:hypothetical protein
MQRAEMWDTTQAYKRRGQPAESDACRFTSRPNPLLNCTLRALGYED